MFKILYPPLIRCLKIELCAKNAFQDSVLATEYIYLDDISHPKTTGGSLPSYGPSYIDLYEEPYLLTLQKKPKPAEYQIYSSGHVVVDNEDKPRNVPLIENTTCSLVTFNGYAGNRFIGRLLLNIESSKFYRKNAPNITDCVSVAPELKSDRLYSKSDFIVFTCLTECSMINERYSNSELSFRLTIGNFGYNNNAENSHERSNFTHKATPIQLTTNMPLYIPLERRKPCLSVEFSVEDTSHVLYKMNYIRARTTKMVSLES